LTNPSDLPWNRGTELGSGRVWTLVSFPGFDFRGQSETDRDLVADTGWVQNPSVLHKGMRFAHECRELFKISEFLQGSIDFPSTVPSTAERKRRSKTLTSNHVFLCIISSSCAFHMIPVPAKMGQALAMEVSEIGNNLFFFGR
jgi:hypothetical protein